MKFRESKQQSEIMTLFEDIVKNITTGEIKDPNFKFGDLHLGNVHIRKKLTSLKNFPIHIIGDLILENTGLEEIDKQILVSGNVTLVHLHLQSFDNFPLMEYDKCLKIVNCNVKDLKFLKDYRFKELSLARNKITSLENCPATDFLDIILNPLNNLMHAPECEINYDGGIENRFVNQKSNIGVGIEYFKQLLDFMIENNDLNLEEINWPENFLDNNFKNSAKGITKFDL